MALLSTTTDSFGGTLNGSIWTTFTVAGATGETVATTGGRLRITHDHDFNYGTAHPPSTGAYSTAGEFASDSVYCRFYPPTSGTGVAWKLDTFWGVFNRTNKEGIGWFYQDGSLQARVWNDYDTEWDATITTLTYSGTSHAWLRVRHDTTAGGTFYWDTAPDSGSGTPGTWTNRASTTVSSGTVNWDSSATFLGTAGARIMFWHDHWDNTISQSDISSPPEFDGVNAPLVGTTTYNESVSETATVTHTVSSTGIFASTRTDTATVTHTVSSTTVFQNTWAETLSPTDSAAGGLAYPVTRTDTASPTDAATGGLSFAGSMLETSILSDLWASYIQWEKVNDAGVVSWAQAATAQTPGWAPTSTTGNDPGWTKLGS